ncbi:hypothetical protein FOD75_07700 [Limosilactobacillus reuteri]|uniref:Uncharacterized protein n=2 Tax=Limosilactobacillus reuteri TaxID=1598 RepID=A0A517D6H3_LIMRT|nr:hypothetical protein FOD75_07700 [Limosilactobacillus reuteri]
MPVHNSSNYYNNSSNGDARNMNIKCVTFKEFNYALNEINKRFDELDRKLDHNRHENIIKFEKANTKFEHQKVWFFGTAISIIGAISAIVAIIGTFLKVL